MCIKKVTSFAFIFIHCLLTHPIHTLSQLSEPSNTCNIKTLNYDPTPYILPLNHALTPILKALFPTQDVIHDEKTFAQAGFITLRAKKSSGIRLATHPNMPGYLVKLYLETQKFHRGDMSKQNWLIQRCRGAAKFRRLIARKNIQHFTVPEKWLFELPKKPTERRKRTFILVETYMNLVSTKDTLKALKRTITKEHLNELILFMKIGGAPGSGAFHLNAPYTVEGKFAFIDTEYPDRIFPPEKVKKIGRFFSSDMERYWIRLVDQKM